MHVLMLFYVLKKDFYMQDFFLSETNILNAK